jgi:hypothetical protein
VLRASAIGGFAWNSAARARPSLPTGYFCLKSPLMGVPVMESQGSPTPWRFSRHCA